MAALADTEVEVRRASQREANPKLAAWPAAMLPWVEYFLTIKHGRALRRACLTPKNLERRPISDFPMLDVGVAGGGRGAWAYWAGELALGA